MLKEKLLKAMLRTSSQNPISVQALAKGRKVGDVRAALGELLNERKVYSCRITKGKQTADVWWLAGNVNTVPLNYNQTIRARKLRAARAKIEEEQDGD